MRAGDKLSTGRLFFHTDLVFNNLSLLTFFWPAVESSTRSIRIYSSGMLFQFITFNCVTINLIYPTTCLGLIVIILHSCWMLNWAIMIWKFIFCIFWGLKRWLQSMSIKHGNFQVLVNFQIYHYTWRVQQGKLYLFMNFCFEIKKTNKKR